MPDVLSFALSETPIQPDKAVTTALEASLEDPFDPAPGRLVSLLTLARPENSGRARTVTGLLNPICHGQVCLPPRQDSHALRPRLETISAPGRERHMRAAAVRYDDLEEVNASVALALAHAATKVHLSGLLPALHARLIEMGSALTASFYEAEFVIALTRRFAVICDTDFLDDLGHDTDEGRKARLENCLLVPFGPPGGAHAELRNAECARAALWLMADLTACWINPGNELSLFAPQDEV